MASRDCQVCLESYDEEKRKPRCLSCGHTLCNSCIADCLSRGPLLCPFCRLAHAAPVTYASDVPVNYTVISLLQDASYPLASQRTEALLAEVKKEANEFTTSQLVTCNCRLTRLHDFQQRLNEQCSVHRVHVQALRSLVERHEGLLQDMTGRAEQAAAIITKGEEIRSMLESAQGKVNGATNLLEVTAAHEEDRRYKTTVTEWDAAAHHLLQSQVVAAAMEVSGGAARRLTLMAQFSGRERGGNTLGDEPGACLPTAGVCDGRRPPSCGGTRHVRRHRRRHAHQGHPAPPAAGVCRRKTVVNTAGDGAR
uniref:RING-type domain-containing protein n=1 Tax=Scylla olivacea TaxID=85551 RepID=A0A0P4WBJ5_SCYOL